MPGLSRRELLRTLASGSAVAFAGGWTTGVHAQPQAGGVRIRADAHTLERDSPTVKALMAGVKAMQDRENRNPADPRGWRKQAEIHLNQCAHHNWFFLPWHRAYLYYFEDICRAAAQDETFALPYWDWSKNPGLPPYFFDRDSPLFHKRAVNAGSRARDDLTGQRVIDDILETDDFITFGGGAAKAHDVEAGQGTLENGPHNYIHGSFVKEDMATYLSPLDPIFWLHHANVDRLWSLWNRKHSGRAPSSDAGWAKYDGLKFFDRDGKDAGKHPGELLSTYDLGYRYDTDPERPLVFSGRPVPIVAVAPPDATVSTRVNSILSKEKPTLIATLRPTPELNRRVAATAFGPRATPEFPSIRLKLRGVVASDPRAVAVRVFVNCPGLTQFTAINNPHYVGSFSFFQHPDDAGKGEHKHKGLEASFYLDLTPTLRRMAVGEAYKEGSPLEVQLVAVGVDDLAAVGGTVKVDSVTISHIRHKV